MNEVVKYHNDLNGFNIGAFTESQMNILFTILAKIKNKNTEEITLDIDDIIDLAGIQKSNNIQLNETIFNSLKKMQSLIFRWSDEKEDGQGVAFYSICRRKNSNQISIQVHHKFSYLFNNLMNNFTRFELAEFVNLSSKYAKTLYRLLKQYRHTGIFEIKWQHFIDIMGISSNYKMKDIDKIILKPIVKELQKERNLFDEIRRPFKNLKFEKCKTPGKGNKITHIKFTFEPQTNEQEPLITEQNNQELSQQNHETIKRLGKTKTDWTDEYIERHFISKGNANEYDTCKILRITKTDECYLLTAKNQENNSQFTKEFETKLHFENWYKKVQF